MSESDISQGWHYSLGGDQVGPVSAEHLVKLHLGKQVRPDDQVWHPSLPAWCTLREAWPQLRPFRDNITGGSGSRGARRAYKVVEANAPLTGQGLQAIIEAEMANGWTLHQVVSGGAVTDGMSLVVLQK